MKSLHFYIPFLDFSVQYIAQTVGTIIGQMGTTWNERDGKLKIHNGL